MANLSVTYADMQAAGGQLKTGKNDIEQTLMKLKALIDTLVAGGYVTDNSSRAFASSYEEFNTGVTKVVDGLEGMGTYLERAASAFEDADKQLAAALA